MLDLSQRMVERLRFPGEFGGWTADRRDDFKHSYRYDVSDVLLCCCEVTGWKPVLDALARKLQTDLQGWQATLAASSGRPGVDAGSLPGWEGVEAGLYSIRAIARYVPDDEATVLPSLFALLPQLPPHTELRATSFRLIGRYHQWMARHPDAAGPCFEFVVTRGLLPRPDAGRE
jgi:transportin-3